MVKCVPEFEYFTVFLKNKNIISKIGRSKVTDYAALNVYVQFFSEDIDLRFSLRISTPLFVDREQRSLE